MKKSKSLAARLDWDSEDDDWCCDDPSSGGRERRLAVLHFAQSCSSAERRHVLGRLGAEGSGLRLLDRTGRALFVKSTGSFGQSRQLDGVARGREVASQGKAGSNKKKKARAMSKKKKKLLSGARVEARYKGWGRYCPGVIKGLNADGSYHVQYDDGTEERNVRVELIRMPDEERMGERLEDSNAGQQVHIKFPDGRSFEVAVPHWRITVSELLGSLAKQHPCTKLDPEFPYSLFAEGSEDALPQDHALQDCGLKAGTPVFLVLPEASVVATAAAARAYDKKHSALERWARDNPEEHEGYYLDQYVAGTDYAKDVEAAAAAAGYVF
jgi:hypothetical protein